MVKKKQDPGRMLLKGKKKDSDGFPQTMAASSSAAAVVVDNDSTKQPRRKKTRAQMDKHNEQCRESRLRGKNKIKNMAAENRNLKEQCESMKQELISQEVSYEEKISHLESLNLALRSVLQQKEEENERLKQSPSEWPFKELGDRGIRNAEHLQDFLLSENDKYIQDGQYVERRWNATGFMPDIERLCPDEPDDFNPMDFVVEPGTIENNTGANETAAVSSDLGLEP